MNFIFNIGNNLGDLHLDYDLQKVISILGKPNEIKHYLDSEPINDSLQNKYLVYDDLDLHIGFGFDDFDNYRGLSITTKKIIYNGLDWSEFSKKKMITIIKSVFQSKDLDFLFEREVHDYGDYKFEEYNFENIGLTVYFENNRFDGAVVYKPLAVEKAPKKKPKLKTYQLEPLETDLQMVSEPKTEYKRTKKQSQ